MSAGGEIPFGDVEPLSSDQHCVALVAIGAARAGCEDIPDEGVTNAIAQGDTPRHMKS